MNKKIISVLCVTAVLLAGCNKADSSSKEDTADDSKAVSAEQSESIAEMEAQIAALEANIQDMQDFISSVGGIDVAEINGDFDGKFETYDYAGDVHEIYDDTTVVAAYASGDTTDLSEEDAFVLETASAVIDELITDDMTEYEKELAIYNWQVAYVAYDEGNLAAIPSTEDYSHLPYGVLKYHTAICVGNATTFKLFMDMLGIDCQIIHSTEQGEHAWNLVKIDGDWYHVDVTFDSGMEGTPSYAYFNVPDIVKQDGGYPWDPDAFPAATSLKYCYAVQNSSTITDIYTLPQLIQDAISSGKNTIYLSSEDAALIGEIESAVYYIEESMTNWWLYCNTIWLDDDYSKAVVTVNFETYEDEPYYEPDTFDTAQMDAAIAAAFQ